MEQFGREQERNITRSGEKPMTLSIHLDARVSEAFKGLKVEDKGRIDASTAKNVVDTFLRKREKISDVGQAITYTLSERHISSKSRETYAAYARLLRRVESGGKRMKGAA